MPPVIRAWLAAHRSTVATATSGTLVAALVATVAIVSGGYSAQRMDLDDGAVWVANSGEMAIGRANIGVLELNSVVGGDSSSLDVVQHADTVLLFDRGNNKVDIVDPATSEVGESIPLPPSAPRVFLAGSRAVVTSQGTGEIWLMQADDLAAFDSQSEPTLSFGAGTVTSVDADGVLFAYSPDAGELYRVDTAVGDSVVSVQSLAFEAAEDRFQVTSLGGLPAVYDGSTGELAFGGRRIDLAETIADPGAAVLQEPSADVGDLLVAHPGGMLAVPRGAVAPAELAAVAGGVPAAPVRVDGCDHGAWASGAVWRRCGTAEGETAQLESVPVEPALAFRVNGRNVVLNDALGGASWAVQRNNERIDNWDDLIQRDEDRRVVEKSESDVPPDFEKTQMPPVAVDDEMGVRAGRANVLRVLLNDYDPNGDMLVISELTPMDESLGRLELVAERQRVQLTLAPNVTGRLSFGYTITDGRGGSASATVSVIVRGDDENSPPRQVRPTNGTVQEGGRISRSVLGDWDDPDGDAFYLTEAVTDAPDSVTWKPEGTVVFTEANPAGGEIRPVSLVVSDGRASGAGSLSVTVRRTGEVPIIASPFVVLAYAGVETTITPLLHVRGGSGPVRLTNVPTAAGSTIAADYDGGTFRFTATEIRTHYLEYAVSDGAQTVTGTLRVEVIAPPEANTTPITVSHTAFIHELSTLNVDVLATDIDPAGGVLLVTGVTDVPEDSGVRVEILDQRLLRVTLTRPLDGPVAFTYRVSNGLAQADGTVTVIEIPEPAVKQPPIAVPDTVSVRVGDAIDIPVLANDSQPEGDPLTLSPTLAQGLPADSGLLFAAEDRLRYLAPDTTGNFTAVYRVEAPDGQWATAAVTIAVREVDEASNNPPVPKTLTARVIAGERVRIPVTLTGIDPDGDSVQLLGQERSPEKGSVTAVGDNWIEYEAGDYSAGTDTFTYAVVDALGARATGAVRVGVSARYDGARNPIAIPDEVTVRPGSTVSVQVLANDSDPDGGALRVTGVAPTVEGVEVTHNDEVVRVSAPEATGRYGFVYDIENERGGTSSNFLTVVVAEDAPLSRPVASDTVLTLSDVLGRRTIDVNVLANVFFADGPVSSLGISASSASAEVTDGKRVRVTLGNERQIIPFRVSHPDDPDVAAYAFIWVPGFADALPQLRKDAPRLTVPSESPLTIDLADYVVAVEDRKVRLTDANTVRATHSGGQSLVVDADTLRFTSEAKYFGPASISFEVTDGSAADDPEGRKATLVLPITVTPKENQPPAFNGAVLEFEPGQERDIDLLKLTTYPYADDRGELVYSIVGQGPTSFTSAISGQTLHLRADEGARAGTTSAFTVAVSDSLNEGTAGRIDLRIVPSTRPLAQPAADTAVAPRGRTTQVDVLQNDEATNPFPGRPLSVSAVRGIDSGSLPAGVQVVPSADRSTLAITVGADVAPGDVAVQYQVTDATGDPSRSAWGTVRISVQDRPDPVANLRTTGFGDRRISVAFDAAAFNNSPIQGYEVQAVRGGTVVSSQTCVSTTCDVATDGNGPDRRVSIRVSGVNGIGASDPTALQNLWSDVIPSAPTGLRSEPLSTGLRVLWDPVDTGGGSAVTNYIVTVGGVVRDVPAGTTSIEVRDAAANDSDVSFSVSPRNRAQVTSAAVWNAATGSGVPLGRPQQVGTPTPEASHDEAGTVVLRWQPFSGSGRDGIRYWVAAYQGGDVPSCSLATEGVVPWSPSIAGAVPADAPDSHRFTGLTPNREYRFAVIAVNSQGCTLVTEIRPVTPRLAPTVDAVRVTTAAGGDLTGAGGVSRPALAAVDAPGTGGDAVRQYVYRVSGRQTEETVAPGETLTLAPVGDASSIEVKAVDTYGDGTRLESAWSAPESAGVAVDARAEGMRFTPSVAEDDDEEAVAGSGIFSWTRAPSGTGYDAVDYSTDGGETWTTMPKSGESATTGGADRAAELIVRVTANGTAYTQHYRGD